MSEITTLPETGWDDPIPFESIELPPFPLQTLPSQLRGFVEAVATSTQTPPDLAAVLGLTVCSFCLSGKLPIVIRDDWRLGLNLYSVVLLESGSRKSSVFLELIAPVDAIEKELIEREKPNIALAQAAFDNDRAVLKRLQSKLGSAESKSRAEADALAAKLNRTRLPVEPRLLIDNPSTEYVEKMLHDQRRPMGIFTHEGGFMEIVGGRYSKKGGANLDIFLCGYDGSAFRSGRIERGETRIENALLTIGSTLQPSVLDKLREQDEALTTRGFFPRFLIVCPKGNVGHRSVDPPTIPPDLRDEYDWLVRTLWEAPKNGEIRLSQEADRLRLQWMNEVEVMLRDDGELGRLKEWGAKLVGNTMKLPGNCLLTMSRSPNSAGRGWLIRMSDTTNDRSPTT
jgi:hypothetical protein